MKNLKIQSIIRVTLSSAFILLSYPEPGQAAQFIEDSIKDVTTGLYRAVRPELEEGVEILEETIGESIPRVVRNRLLPPTMGQRICNFLNDLPRNVSRNIRSIGICLGIIRRPRLFERLESALDDLLE
jgi:hypothetical protein